MLDEVNEFDLKMSKEHCKMYLQSRRLFLTFANESKFLSGNDNIIGRIGEFVALQFLKKRNPRKNLNPTEKGYDLICDVDTKVSVKMITWENSTQRTTRIKEPWDELIVIFLNDDLEIGKLGHLTKIQFLNCKKLNSKTSNEPYCKLSMLNKNGMITKHGKTFEIEELRSLNLL